jgi:hypothetical protein
VTLYVILYLRGQWLTTYLFIGFIIFKTGYKGEHLQ